MSKSRKAKSVALLLALAFVFTSLFSSIGAVAFAAGEGTRLEGNIREETAVEISKAGWATSDAVILVNGYAFPDALAAGPLAQKLDAPILLTTDEVLPDVTKAEIDRLGAEKVYIVGGTTVVPDSVAEATGKTFERIAGDNREKTAVAVAEKLKELGVSTNKVVIARSDGYADALAAAAVKPAMPILFAGAANSTSLANVTEDAMVDLGVKDVVIVGGTEAVSAEIQEQIANMVTNVNRVAGNTGIETAVKIAEQFKPADGYKGAVLATGYGYADALAGGPYAAKNGYALLLTGKASNPIDSVVIDFIKANTGIKADTIVALGGSKAVPDEAITGAVEAATPVVLQVVSVSAINLKSFVVNFNKEVDSTTLKASSTAATTDTLRVYNAAGNLVNVTVTLAEDKKSAVVVFGATLAQSDSFKVVVDGVKATDGEVIEKYEQTHTAIDVTSPEATSAAVKNSKQIEITFSEPINETSLAALASNYTTRTEFLVDGNPVVAKVTPDYAANKLVLDLTSSLAVGDHKLTVKNVKDFAGFPIASKDFDIKVVSDTAAPQVTSVKVLNKELVQVVFNEPVSSLGTININSVNIAGYASTTKTDAAKLNTSEYMKSADGLTYTFRLGTPIGADALLNGIKLDYINTTDVEGNKVASKVEVAAEVSDDTTAPTATVELIAVNDTTRGLNRGDILITFSEEMSTLPTVELKDKDGNTVNVGTISFAATATFGYKKAIVIPASTTGLNNVDGGTYTITVKDAKDNGLRQKTMVETTVSLTAVDTKVPSVTGVILTNASGTVSTSNPDKVTIYFSEAMDKSTIENAANYLLTKDNDAIGGAVFGLLSQEPSLVSIKAADDNKFVTFSFSTDVDADGTNEWAFKLLGVKDANGNAYTSINTVHPVTTPVALTKADLTFELIAKDEVKVKVTGASLSNLDPNEVQFLYDADAEAGTDVDTVFAYGTSIKSMNADKTEAVIKLSAPLNADGTARVSGSDYAVKVAIAKVGDPTQAAVNTKDGVGTVVSLTDTTGDGNLDTLDDKVAPTLKSATIASETAGDPGNAEIVLTFDEAVIYTNTTLINALVVKDLTDNKVLTPSEFAVEVNDNDADIVIGITKSGVKDHKFSVALGNGTFITDAAAPANAMSPIAETVVKKADGTDALLTERTVAFTAGYPKAGPAGAAGSKEVTVLVQAPENGKAYFKVVADDATAPTADAVVADNVSVNVTANTEVSKTLVMVADGTAYDVYVVFVDEVGNKTPAIKVDVTSPAGV
jgi:putative cell wall-binding protein/methionine-rich copper-binding protein CopC